MANKGRRARYIMSSRTHKKTRLRNSNDIMFAPLFSRRKSHGGPREEEGNRGGRKGSASATGTQRGVGDGVGGMEGNA